MKKKDILMVLWYPHILQSFLLCPRWIIKNLQVENKLKKKKVAAVHRWVEPYYLNVVDLHGSVSLSFR